MVCTDELGQNSVSQEHTAQVRQSETSIARDIGQESRKSDYKEMPVSRAHAVCPLAFSELFAESGQP